MGPRPAGAGGPFQGRDCGYGTDTKCKPFEGLGIAVFTNRTPNEVPSILTWYILDRLRGRDPVNWRERQRKRRDELLAPLQTNREVRAKARHMGTRPAHDLAAYAGDYENAAYGVMSIRAEGGALHWSWRGMAATMTHRHYRTFELPEAKDRLLPDLLAITFLTDHEGNVGLSAPLEPMVKDIVFARLAAGECTDVGFRARCVGRYKRGATMHDVMLNRMGSSW